MSSHTHLNNNDSVSRVQPVSASNGGISLPAVPVIKEQQLEEEAPAALDAVEQTAFMTSAVVTPPSDNYTKPVQSKSADQLSGVKPFSLSTTPLVQMERHSDVSSQTSSFELPKRASPSRTSDITPFQLRNNAVGNDEGSTVTPFSPGIVQRAIDHRLPVKFYRKAGGSASSRINMEIERYNQIPLSAENREALLRKLGEIDRMLDGISLEKKGDAVQAIKADLVSERATIDAVQEVMGLARGRAELQHRYPLEAISPDAEIAAGRFMEGREVSHAVNPLKQLGGGRSLGDVLAKDKRLKNIQETRTSDFGKNDDGPKRKNAEVGLFYPERYRRPSFIRNLPEVPKTTDIDQDNDEDRDTQPLVPPTRGLAIQPPDAALPIYGAVNMAESPLGALRTEDVISDRPLHFAIKEQVLRDRTTFTSSDSLREWKPSQTGFERLKKRRMIGNDDRISAADANIALPTDGNPWNMGPIAVHGSRNFGQLLATADMTATAPAKNPHEYIEAQIHGGLRIDRDVAHVRANFAKLFGNPRFKSLYDLFRSQKIRIYWYYYSNILNPHSKVPPPERLPEERKSDGQFIQDWNDEESNKNAERSWKAANTIWVDNNKRFPQNNPGSESVKAAGVLYNTQEEKLHLLWGALAGAVREEASGTDVTPQIAPAGGEAQADAPGLGLTMTS